MLYMERGGMEPCLLTQQFPDLFFLPFVRDEHMHGIILAGTGTVEILEVRLDEPLGLVQPDAIAKDLEEALFAADDGEKTILVEGCHITGAELAVPLVALGEVFTVESIAEGHVPALIEQFTDDPGSRDFMPLLVEQVEPPARDGDSHGAVFFQALVCGKVGHARRGF